MIRIAIVENEKEQEMITRDFLTRYGQENHLDFEVESFNNGYDFLESPFLSYELIFMDIDMPGINGMEVSSLLRGRGSEASLVFVTNLPQFAIDGYKVAALDFILKPMTYADFTMTMERFMKSHVQEEDKFFLLSVKGKPMRFEIEDTLYFEMINHDVCIHLVSQDNVLFRGSMKDLESKMDSKVFFKANSGCLVNLKKIKTVRDDVLVMENGDLVSVSRSHRKEVLSKLNDVYSERPINTK